MRLPSSQQTPVNTTAGVAGLSSREIRPPGSQSALEYQTARAPGLSSRGIRRPRNQAVLGHQLAQRAGLARREIRLPGSQAVVEFQTAGWPGRLAGKSSSARFPPVCCSKPARSGTLRTTSPSLGLRPFLHRPIPSSPDSTLKRPDQGKSHSYSGSTTSDVVRSVSGCCRWNTPTVAHSAASALNFSPNFGMQKGRG